MDDDKAGLILNAIGLAVVDLVASQVPIDLLSLLCNVVHCSLLFGCNKPIIHNM